MLLLGYVCAFAIGVILGMLGGGGSILTVPVFVYVLGYDPKLAIAMSLPVVGATSLVGAAAHWRAGNVQVRTAILFGAVAMSSAYVAARLSTRLASRTQLLVLSVAMVAAAVVMLRDALRAPRTVPTGDGHPPFGITLLLAGLVVGVLTGIIGIGGGFLIVPALVVLARVPMQRAVGTSLTVIAMNAAAAFAGQPAVRDVPIAFVVAFGAVAMAGIVAGTSVARRVDQRTLKRAFATLLLVIAAGVLSQNLAHW